MDFQRPLSVLLFVLLPVMIFGQLLIPYLGTNGQYGYADIKGSRIVQPVLASCPYFLSLKQPSQRVKMDGAEISILRNGTFVAPANYLPVQNDAIYRDPNPATLFNVLWGKVGNDLVLIDLDTGKSVKYLNRPEKDRYESFLDQTRVNSTYYKNEPKFFKGVMPVWKSTDLINFIDIQLNEIFPRDFVAGALLDDQYFILADGPSRFALGDRSGKILTPFAWSNIASSKKSDIFIVNMPYTHPDNKAGLINANGKIILDTLYESIEALETGRHLIVKRNGLYGICNYDGKIVLPIEFYQIEQIRKSGFLKVSRDRKNWDILNHDLQSILDTPAEEISTPSGMGAICAIVEKEGVKAYYDQKLNLIIRDSQRQDIRVIHQNPLLIEQNHYLQGAGIIDSFHNEILPQQYSSIYLNPKGGYFMVKKAKGGRGVRDIKGNMVVPEIYEDISEEATPNGRVFWCMDSTYFWTPYDSTGKLLNIGKKISPRLNSSDFVTVSCKIKTSGGMYMAASPKDCVMVLTDGTAKPLNDSLVLTSGTTLFEGYVPQIPTRDGGFILNFERKNQKHYFNHRLQNLVKPGYEVFQYFQKADQQIDYISNIGLLPMLKFRTAAAQEVDIPVQVPGISSAESVEPMILDEQNTQVSTSYPNRLDELFEFERFHPYDQSTTEFVSFEAGGIINAKGEWVKAPKKGSYFIPVSYYLAIEVPLNLSFFANAIYPNHLKIHKINQSDTSTIAINRIGEYYFKPGDRVRISRADPTGTYLINAYINEKGDFLTPFNVATGPAVLVNQNLITTLSDDNNRQISQRIVDENGKSIKTLGTLFVMDPYSMQQKILNPFLIVEDYGKNLYLSDSIKKDPNAIFKQGIIDSMGNLVIKPQYDRIKIQVPGRLFSAYDAKGQLNLLDWKEKVIFIFKPGEDEKQPLSSTFEPSCVQLPDGKTIVFNDRTTIILSEHNKLLKVFPYQYVSSVIMEGQWFLKVKEKNNKLEFYIHADSGRLYRD